MLSSVCKTCDNLPVCRETEPEVCPLNKIEEEDDTDLLIAAELKAERAFEEWFHRGTGY